MRKSVGRPKKLVAGKLPKEQYEIAKKQQQERMNVLNNDPRYQEKMDKQYKGKNVKIITNNVKIISNTA